MSKCLEDIIPGEKKKAAAAKRRLPVKARPFYSAQYGAGIGNKAGEFLGLACKACDRWLEYGHEDDCPVQNL